MWTAPVVERKARFIAQVMRGRLDVREIEDIGDAALSYNEVKALAAGNPLLMDKAEADAELIRLQRTERAYHRNQDTLRFKITSAEQRIVRLTTLAGDIDAAIGRRHDTRGDAFAMTLDGVTYTKRSQAGHRLMQFLDREITALTRSGRPRAAAQPGHVGGFEVTATTQRILGTIQVTLVLDGVPESGIHLTAKDLAGMDAAGLIIRLENRLNGLEALKTKTLSEIERMHAEAARARADAGKEFPPASQLAAARRRVQDIDQQLEEAARPHPPEPPKGEGPDPGSSQAGESAAVHETEYAGDAATCRSRGAVAVTRRDFPDGSSRFLPPGQEAVAESARSRPPGAVRSDCGPGVRLR